MPPIALAVAAAMALCLSSCASMAPAEALGAVAAGGGALVGIIETLSPYIPPAKVAELATHVSNATSVIDMIAHGLGAVAEASQQAQSTATAAQRAADNGVSLEGGLGGGSALAGAAFLASRLASRIKHSAPKES